jgi:hypothetical protein
MNILQSGSTTELAHFHEAQATYRNKKQKSTTIEIFSELCCKHCFVWGFLRHDLSLYHTERSFQGAKFHRPRYIHDAAPIATEIPVSFCAENSRPCCEL